MNKEDKQILWLYIFNFIMMLLFIVVLFIPIIKAIMR